MPVCTLDYQWPVYIICSLVSLFAGLAVLFTIRGVTYLIRLKRVQNQHSHRVFSSEDEEDQIELSSWARRTSGKDRLAELRFGAEAILSGNTTTSKIIVS